MVRNVYCAFFLCFSFVLTAKQGHAGVVDLSLKVVVQDTLEEQMDSETVARFSSLTTQTITEDSLNMIPIKKNPFLQVGDFIKGQVSGVHVQTPSAEPGTFQHILIRGLSGVQFSNRDINDTKATVFVNGVPISIENGFAYDIQLYDYNRIGPATDYLSSIDLSAIKSIEVIKDPIRLAELGPLAANGAIWITTYGGKSGDREISVNGYYGVNTKPAVTPLNAEYENLFRQNFYKRYGTVDDQLRYPGYLSDETNVDFYGASDWKDLYYSTSSLYTVDMSLRGGTDRANFGFFGSHTKNAISSDDTGLKRYNALFNVNMLPFKWFTVSTYLNARRLDRNRNTNLRDRYAEMAYLPDLSTPLAPNKQAYNRYLNHYRNDVVDDNVSSHLQGNIRLGLDILPNLNFSTSFALDYNEGVRDLFYPGTLMETINYMSTYYGYSQRYVFSNKLSFWQDFGENQFTALVGSDYSEDLFRYNFARAYDGPNDYIKLNVVEGNPNEGDYLEPRGDLRVLRYNNKEQFHLHSLYGKLGYAIKDVLAVTALMRWDGSSTVQRDSRWLFSPAVSATWNLDKQLGWENPIAITGGFSRVGKPSYTSRFAAGPSYGSSLGWSQDPIMFSYYGYAGISRDYSYGWIGHDLKWAYSDKYEVSVSSSWFNNRLSGLLAFYLRDDKDQIIRTPVPQEFGYTGQYLNGLTVRNQGLDVGINGVILPVQENKVGWTAGINFNLNKNKLTALPNGRQELELDGRFLKVGEGIDRFWVYENQGIYNNVSDIPVNPTNSARLNSNGVPFEVGDARWVDQNNDYNINEDDKVLAGRFTPKFYGGFNQTLTYRGFDLDLGFTYALGVEALNQRVANRYDFINSESANTIGAVKEIFQWQQDFDLEKYPVYNVWSGTNPYRLDQDLFLEDASYLKLRSLSLGYDLGRLGYVKESIKTLRRAYLYVTANNLFTVTKFSGNDPELVNFNGIYDGYGLPLTKSFTIGLKLDL